MAEQAAKPSRQTADAEEKRGLHAGGSQRPRRSKGAKAGGGGAASEVPAEPTGPARSRGGEEDQQGSSPDRLVSGTQ